MFLSLQHRAGNESGVFPPRAGDALSSWKALRDAGRFAGKEDTVPLRLLYSRDNRSQVAQDELSTRVNYGPGSAQVPASCVQESRLQGTAVVLLRACLCLHGFIPSSRVLSGEIRNEPKKLETFRITFLAGSECIHKIHKIITYFIILSPPLHF